MARTHNVTPPHPQRKRPLQSAPVETDKERPRMARMQWEKANRHERARRGPNHTIVLARFSGVCRYCNGIINPGQQVSRGPQDRWYHHACLHPDDAPAARVDKNSLKAHNARNAARRKGSRQRQP